MDNFEQTPDLKFDVTTYGELEKVNDTISKCRVRIFYRGMNRNRTFISDDFASQLISSLPYAPIKGIFNYAGVDFEDHGVDNTDGKIYGIIPENPNFAWEEHLDEDNVSRQYACADVYLFTGLYPEASLIPGKPQSMEIFKKTFDGEWRIWNDGKPYFHFTSGSLVGLQTLGSDVEPCFEGAAFFSLYKDFQDCLKYIKENIKQEESKTMDKTILRLSDSEKAIQIENMLNPNFEETGEWRYCVIDTYDEYALCRDIKEQKFVRVSYTKDDSAVTLGEAQEVFIVDVTQTEYNALMAMQAIGTYEEVNSKYSEMAKSLEDATLVDDASKDIAAEYDNRVKEFEATIAEKDTAIAAFETKVAELEQKISDFEAQMASAATEKETLEMVNEELKNFKTNIEIEQKTAIIDEFAAHLTDEQITAYKESMSNYSVADFKKEVCTAAYDADPTIFSSKDETNLIYKGDVDNKAETGMIRMLNKYKNGGNK